MRTAALPALLLPFLLTAFAAETPPPPEADAHLRARVDGFNKLLVAEKYREAEQFVLPDSRDVYYTSEKPRILDFDVKKIDWENHFQEATVEMSSNVMIRRAAIGSYEVKTGYYSHWKLDKGEWWYYYPQVMERKTPFGTMKVNPTLAHESGLNIPQEIAKGRAEMAAARDKTFGADRLSVSLPAKDSSETILLSNLLPGPIRLGLRRGSGAGFDASLDAVELGPKGTAHLKIFRSAQNKAEFKPGVVSVLSFPTGQVMLITVK